MRPFTHRSLRTRTRAQRGQRRLAQGTALSLVVGSLAVMAFLYDGSPIRDVTLNDGSVWVTNNARGLLGRLNSQVKELDLSLVTSATSDEVFQQGSSVQVFDDGGGGPTRSVTIVDVVSGTTLPVLLNGTFETSSGGGTLAIMEGDTGRAWIRRLDQLDGFDPSEPPTLQVSQRSFVTVTASGTALVADRKAGTVTSWRFDETGTPVAGDKVDFDTTFLDDAVLTAVGEVPVVLQGGKLYRPGRDPVSVEGDDAAIPDDAKLQQVGRASASVYLATRSGLWRGALDGDDLTEMSVLDVDGEPAAPVNVAGCVHSAWNVTGSNNYLRVCDGDETVGEAKGTTSESNLVFRVNRDVVVLNDMQNGTSWLVQESGLTRVDNWDSVDPNSDDPQIAQADDEAVSSHRNKPPTAVDDRFGARAGATVILPVTLNDIDPDGDVLVLTEPPSSQDDTTFSVVGDGTQIQAKVGANVTGDVSFGYTISDGQPGNPPSDATVTLIIAKSSTDTPPTLIKGQTNELTVAVGHQASVNVLPAWIDPEGDPVILVGAETDAGTVGFRPDGTIDFADDGSGAAEETVRFTLRGGGATREGLLDVTVVDPDTAEPATVADHFTGAVGSVVLLDPLANDTDPLGGQLALSNVSNISRQSAQVVRDGTRGTATFRAAQPGAYYLTYQATASNGVAAAEQTIRVDVAPASDSNRAPIATRDIAALRQGGSVLVDVLANDTDPDGDVLVVQGVAVPAEFTGLVKASLINKRFVRVELSGPLTGDVEPVVEYLLSDGRSDQVKGAVAVTVAESGKNRAPLPVEDLVTARAGTIIDIPVLENDKDPDGDRMTVEQQDLYDIGASSLIKDRQVPIVATGSSIRVLVPDDGSTQLQFGYGVRDPEKDRGDSRVVLNIKPDDPVQNQKPQPRPIEDRTVTGQTIRVQVDSYGSDPDGDPVVLVGLLEPPKLGRITASGSDWFEYDPFEDARRTGTDNFKIQLADQYGLTGVADVRIGVAPPAVENQAPSALDDQLLVKPGLTVQYPVLRNDSDPDGDALILGEDDLVPQDGTKVRLVDGSIEIETPESGNRREVVQAVQYDVSDGLGGTSSAVFAVTTRADAPDYAPTTQDDVVTVDQLRGKEAGDTVDVDVLANDGDLDGSREDLRVEPVDPKVATAVDRKVRVTLRPKSQLIPYLVTDETDQSSFGFIYVNGTDSMPPMLDTTAVPLKVVAGERLTIDLDKVVVVRPGHTPKVGNSTLITASNGDVSIKSASRMSFRSAPDFYGTATVTLPVIDGNDLQDSEGLEAQITIPITVLPSANVPPQVRDTAVTVTAGGDEATVQLDRLASDPNPDDKLKFEVSGADDGVTAEIEGTVLTISAGESAPTGSVPLEVTVSDGTAPPVNGHVRVTVFGTPPGTGTGADEEPVQPLMTLRDIDVPDASANKSISVDARDAILLDPYPDKPKQIVSASVTGPASQPRRTGTEVTVVPNGDGEVVVTYELSDGSGDSARDVQGRITITVAAPPGAPSPPHLVEGGPDSIQLSWSAPDDNGSEITKYRVTWDGGQQECQATQCLVAGLNPGQKYRFKVAANNAKGWGEDSAWSDYLTPDTVPNQMNAPTISEDYTQRNGELHLSWTPPVSEGSDITGYKIQSFPQANIPDLGPKQTSVVVPNLTNGTGYRFQILAVNDRGDGPWSPSSEEATPFTAPDKMAAPALAATNDNGDQKGYVTVTWSRVNAPQNGWDEVTQYTVRLLRDGAELTTVQVGGDSTQKSFDVENGHSYSAQVMATNRAGASEFSNTSDTEVSWDRSQAVSAISNASDCPDNACAASTSSYVGRVSFTTPADNGGYPVTSYRWSTQDGKSGTINGMPQGEGVPAAFNLTFNGTQQGQQVGLTPVSNVPGQGPVDGTSSSGGSFNPYAKPKAPTQTCGTGGYKTAKICWSDGDGNGRAINSTEYRGDASGARPGGSSVEIETDVGGDQKCVQVRARNAGGLWSDWTGNLCATSLPFTVDIGVYAVSGDPPGPCTSNCDAIEGRVTGLANNQRYSYSTNIVASTGGGPLTGSITTDSSGRATKVLGYYDRTVYDEAYCWTVNNKQACVNGN